MSNSLFDRDVTEFAEIKEFFSFCAYCAKKKNIEAIYFYEEYLSKRRNVFRFLKMVIISAVITGLIKFEFYYPLKEGMKNAENKVLVLEMFSQEAN